MISSNLSSIYKKIFHAASRVNRDPNEITLIAVSKGFFVEAIIEGADCGLRHFGENRLQEAKEKIQQFNELTLNKGYKGVKWHFIGHLQTNKVKHVVSLFDMIHSVDSIELAHLIDKESEKIKKVQPILIQIKLSEETTKHGIFEERVTGLAEFVLSLKNISFQGLMTMPPFFENPKDARPYFKRLYEIRELIKERFQIPLPHLSMGMSRDFEIAIEEGSTLVRIGTAIFGER